MSENEDEFSISINSGATKNRCGIRDSIKSLSRLKEFQNRFSPADDTILHKPDFDVTISKARKDTWDVAKLPVDFKPISKPSRRLERFLREKEVNHRDAVAKMKEDLRKVNVDFEESYRYSAELLKIFLQSEKSKVDDVVKETLYEPKKTVLYGTLKYNDIPTAICNYSNCCREAVEKFYDKTLFLEKQRCDGYKKIFRCSYLEIYEISHFLPFQVQLFIELEINKFNELLLQNYRCYTEVDTILKSDIEQNKICWHQTLNRNKAKWMDLFKSYGLNTEMLENIPYIEVQSIFSCLTNTIDNKYKEVLATVTQLDDHVNEVLRKCKFALLKIYYGQYDELHTLDESFSVPSDAASHDQLILFQDELKDIMQKVEAEHLLESELDQKNFNKTIDELKERIKKTDVFFFRVSHLWDGHYRREGELNDTVTQHIKKLMEQNDEAIQSVEIQLNIYTDACRSAATKEQMQLNFGYSIAALKKCGNMYYDQMLDEQQILAKYLDMVSVEADVLVAEIVRFLAVCLPSYDFPLPCETKQSTEDLLDEDKISLDYSMDSSAYITYTSYDRHDNKPPHIKYLNFRITSLDNWKYGIWETIEAKMRECKDEMMEKARAWTEPYKHAIDLRHQQKLALNKIMFYRIWLTVYYMRHMEIQQHQDRLDKHKKGINRTTDDLLECQTSILEEVSSLVKIGANDISSLEQEVKNVKSKAYFQLTDAKMKLLKETFRKNVDKLKQNYASEKLKHEYIVKRSNIEYLKNILFFSESGNFHVDEVKALTDELQKSEKDFLKKTANSEKDLLTQLQKISQRNNAAEMSLQNLSNCLQSEFNFLKNINDCMNTLQNEIRNIAYNLKYKRRVVQAYIERVKDLANDLPTNTTKNTLEYFVAKCFEVIKSFEDLYFLLQRNDEYDLLPNITKSTGTSKPSTGKPSTVQTNRDKQSVSNQTWRSASAVISNVTGVGLGNKISQSISENTKTRNVTPFNDDIVNLLCDKMEQMRNFALSFYTTVRSILNKDKIEATFEEFCGNIMAKCSYFQIQCDAMWLEEAIEYVNMSTIFRNGLVETYEYFINTSQENNRSILEQTFANLLELLNDVMVDAGIDIKQVHRRLKTLHGCPKNKQLLADLHSEFLQQLEKYDSAIHASIGDFKTDHKILTEFILDTLTTFDNILRELLANERLRNLNGDMFVQILNLFTKLQSLKRSTTAISDKNTAISKLASDKFSIYKSSLVVIPVPEEYVARFSVGNDSLRIECLSGTFSFDDNDVVDADLVAFACEMDIILANHLEGVDQYIASVKMDCENWNAIWENDVKIIKNLYTVKYAIPDKSDDN